MAELTRGFALDAPKRGDGLVLRLTQRKTAGSLPKGYPFLLSRSELRLLLTLLQGFFGEFPHAPEGCEEGGCPCRRRAVS